MRPSFFSSPGGFQSAVGREETISWSQHSLSRCTYAVAKAIMRVGNLRGWVHFPSIRVEPAAIKAAFLHRGKLPSVIGCVDRALAVISATQLPEPEQQAYFSRAGYYTVKAMVISRPSHVMQIQLHSQSKSYIGIC